MNANTKWYTAHEVSSKGISFLLSQDLENGTIEADQDVYRFGDGGYAVGDWVDLASDMEEMDFDAEDTLEGTVEEFLADSDAE